MSMICKRCTGQMFKEAGDFVCLACGAREVDRDSMALWNPNEREYAMSQHYRDKRYELVLADE